MTRPKSNLEALAATLKHVVGGALRKSFNGQEVWRDDHTWRELSGMIIRELSVNAVFVEREVYTRLVADAHQMAVVRGYVEEYKQRLSREKQSQGTRNPYERWAAEHMPEKKP